MRITFTFVFLFLLAVGPADLMAQKKKGGDEETTTINTGGLSQLEINKAIYKKALNYGDYGTAIYAVYQIMELDASATGYQDTLAYLYFNKGNYVQALLIGNEIVAADENNAGILEVVALSQQNLGLVKDALSSYEKLNKLQPDIYNLYTIATLQFALKRYGECSGTIDALLQSEGNTKPIKITDNNGQSQEVPLKAAALNMLGVMALEMQQTEVAVKSFQEALKVAPDFALAKGNLAKVTQGNNNTGGNNTGSK